MGKSLLRPGSPIPVACNRTGSRSWGAFLDPTAHGALSLNSAPIPTRTGEIQDKDATSVMDPFALPTMFLATSFKVASQLELELDLQMAEALS